MTATTVDSRTASVVLNALPDAPSRARKFVSAVLARWGLTHEETAQSAELLVSEAATNAIRETGRDSGPIEPASDEVVAVIQVRACAIGLCLTVEVWDSSPAQPTPQPADDEAEGGRGLILIEALADEWGTRARIIGKTVWFRLTFPEPDPDAVVPEQRHSSDELSPPSAGI